MRPWRRRPAGRRSARTSRSSRAHGGSAETAYCRRSAFSTISRRSSPLPAPRPPHLKIRPKPGDLRRARDARAMLERLPRPLEPDRLEILKRRHARMLDEEPQQVPLCRCARPARATPCSSHGRGSLRIASCTRCTVACRCPRCSRKGDCSGSRAERRRYTTMSSATLAASASPHSSAMRCSATSIPAVMPALDASGPSTHEDPVVDHLRLRRQRPQRVQQLVVRRAAPAVEQARARREQRARADRHQAMLPEFPRSESRSALFSQRAVAGLAGVTSPRCSVG